MKVTLAGKFFINKTKYSAEFYEVSQLFAEFEAEILIKEN